MAREGMPLPSISNPTSDETTYANEIEQRFRSDFVCYVDPRTLFPYIHDLLSHSDQDRVEACQKENGRADAARLFLELVSSRKDWVSVLKHGLRHDQVQLQLLADKLEQLENCYVVLDNFEAPHVMSDNSEAPHVMSDNSKALHVMLDNSKAPHVMSDNSQAPSSDASFKELRLVLIGPTGTGKSSSGNTIFGKYGTFHVGHELSSWVKTCQWDYATLNDLYLEVTDTTGLYLTYGEKEVDLNELHRALLFMTPGPHAFLLVVKGDRRFTAEEEQAYGQLKSHFGQDMTRHMIVIFTALDYYKNIEEFKEALTYAGTTVHNILQEAGNRWIGFNNRANMADRQTQGENLIEMVKDLVRSNNYSYYSTPQMKRYDELMTSMEREKRLTRRQMKIELK